MLRRTHCPKGLRLLAWALFASLAWTVPLFAAAEPGPYEVTLKSEVMLPMRDRVRLATDVYLPSRGGQTLSERLPTILMRTPYNKGDEKGHPDARYYASHGYAVVFQDTRGRFKSEGVWHWITDDLPDGFDTAEWIGRQPWSNGKIGMLGTSYVGGTQHALAMTKSPYLTTVIPVDSVCNEGHSGMRNGGAFEMRFWNWTMLKVVKGGRQAVSDPAVSAMLQEMVDNRFTYVVNLPLRPGTTPLKHAPEYEQWLIEAMRHAANDSFWEPIDILDHPERYKDMPVYLVGGWYDSWAGNTTANFVTLSRTIKGPVYLIMGPWIHGSQHKSAHGQVSFGPTAAISDHLGWRRQWYDHWLRGIDNNVGKADPFATPVRIFVMGTGEGRKTPAGLLDHGGYWRNEREWPLARTQYTNYYLGKDGLLAPDAPKAEGQSTSLQFDPRNPVPTIGGNISSGEGLLLQGAYDQRGGSHVWNWKEPVPLSARNDVLVFQSAPLAADVEVTGPITVKLWASSSAVDTDFTAKLLDVYPANADYPGGFDLNIADGILRCRYRDSLREEKPMRPGEIYPLHIKLYPTSNVFKKGHRIRVDISSSNFPRFDVNPNTGEPLNDHRRTIVASNTIYHDKDHPSHIVLPVIPMTRK